MKKIFLHFLIIASLILPVVALADSNDCPMFMMGSFSGYGWFGWFLMVLFWALIITASILLIRWIIKQFQSENKDKSALDLLKERYAKGEINEQEFEEKKKKLI